ncbi:MAG TPA: GTP-binding protein [Longimicrobiales bacterium]
MRTPVAIITGFLGSGKTTLLNRLLQRPEMAGVAVIINEFGEIGLDHLLIATPSENTVLLSSGCLCCTVRGDLVETLADLYRKRRDAAIPSFDRVIVETTGLADPVPILQTLVIDPELAPLFGLDSVVTLVDAVNGAQQLDQHPESVKQAAVADRLLLTKTDLASGEATARLRERLARINPGARVSSPVQGAVDPGELFGAGVEDASATAVQRWLGEAQFAQAEAHHHEHDVNRHDDHIRAFCIYHNAPVSAAGLEMWLNMLAALRGARLLRVKGLLNVDGTPVAIHAVQTLIHEPVTLERWPDEDRRSRLVFITRDMSREEIERTLPTLALRPDAGRKSTALDPKAYAEFLEAAKTFR